MALDPKEGLAAGGILALVLGALTALFKYGIPALRNGKHDHDRTDDHLVRVLEKEFDALAEKLLQVQHQSHDRLIAEFRESAASIVARVVLEVDLNARERDADRRDSKRA